MGLWESNRAEGGWGNEKREKDGDETFRGQANNFALTKLQVQGPQKVENFE